MKKNLYYRTVFKRTNWLKEGILNLFLGFSSWPRLMLEVFLRRNFGERYFSFSAALFITCLMAALPIAYQEFISSFRRFMGDARFGGGMMDFIWLFTTWYAYLAGFLYMSLQRREEIKHMPSVFDFGRFSLSTGHIHPFFLNLNIGGKPADVRTIETVLEPGLFAGAGVLLIIMRQPIGTVFLFCSLFYSMSYIAAYRQGDHFVMDKIDEMICNEELVNSFVEGRDASETRGVNYYGRRPADPETRRRLAETFVDENTAEAR